MPPVPSNLSVSVLDMAENCAAPAAFPTFLKMFCAEPRSSFASVSVPPAPRVTGPPPDIPAPAVTVSVVLPCTAVPADEPKLTGEAAVV